jgi:hypothetical protein
MRASGSCAHLTQQPPCLSTGNFSRSATFEATGLQ